MALPSRLGSFMVGTALGGVTCFYWLNEDVRTVQAALSRKIAAISDQVDEQNKQSARRLAALEDAVPMVSQSQSSATSSAPNS